MEYEIKNGKIIKVDDSMVTLGELTREILIDLHNDYLVNSDYSDDEMYIAIKDRESGRGLFGRYGSSPEIDTWKSILIKEGDGHIIIDCSSLTYEIVGRISKILDGERTGIRGG